jgi:hypothetical protein
MLLFTQALGDGTESDAGFADGSSLASADFRVRMRGLSGYRSAAIVSRNSLTTAARSSGEGSRAYERYSDLAGLAGVGSTGPALTTL